MKSDDRARWAIDTIRAGEIVLLVERDQKKEVSRAYLVAAAEKSSAQSIQRLCELSGSAALSLAMPASSWDKLGNFPSVSAKIAKSADRQATNFALTIHSAIDPKRTGEDFEAPGAITVVRTCSRGMLERPSGTEAAVDLSRMAGLAPAAVLAEISADTARSLKNIVDIYSEEIVAHRFRHEPLLKRSAEATIPTELGGDFQTIIYESELDRAEHLALVKGNLGGPEPVLVRLHSKCLTGDVLGSERCDCGPQLHQAMKKLAEEGRGLLLYLDQEGRGIGLANKLKAYALQDRGWDTVSANEELGFAADIRDYGIAAQMLYDLGVRRVRLMTNNPRKVLGLTALGIEVTERVPLEVLPNAHNRKYLETKKEKLGHLLS
jgi:3,4-dihydroxy 2-butanone 4-phosphate synthase/GTP cyclohydrolase II